MAWAWPGFSVEGRRSSRSRPTQPAVPAQPGQVRPPRCDRGRPGRAERSSIGAGKTKDGPVEAIRVLVVAKRSARQARVKAIVQMRHLGFTAPDQLQCRLKGLTVAALVAEAAKLRPTRSSIRSPPPPRHRSRRWPTGSKYSIASSPSSTRRSSTASATAPELLARFGVGPDTPPRCWWPPATTPNVSTPRRHGPTCAGCHRSRPIGKEHRASAPTRRWRPSGQRRAVAHRHGPPRPRPRHQRLLRAPDKEGRTKQDVIRILKRYVAREVYRWVSKAT